MDLGPVKILKFLSYFLISAFCGGRCFGNLRTNSYLSEGRARLSGSG